MGVCAEKLVQPRAGTVGFRLRGRNVDERGDHGEAVLRKLVGVRGAREFRVEVRRAGPGHDTGGGEESKGRIGQVRYRLRHSRGVHSLSAVGCRVAECRAGCGAELRRWN